MSALPAACALALATAAACTRTPQQAAKPPAAVERIRQAEAELGFERTENFQTVAPKTFELCYVADPLRLPADYSGLRLRRLDAEGCARLGRAKDVFFYAPEAVAGVGSPLTESLTEATDARRDFVVAHEDFHDQTGVRELPPTLKEAASTLAGFVASSEAARQRGEEPAGGPSEAELFLKKALLVNRFHRELATILDSWRTARISRRAALARKEELFDELREACEGIETKPQSFRFCPGALNNAGLAFDVTYTKWYPLFFDFYRIYGEDPKRLIRFLREALEAASGREAAAVARIRGLVAQSSDVPRGPK